MGPTDVLLGEHYSDQYGNYLSGHVPLEMGGCANFPVSRLHR